MSENVALIGADPELFVQNMITDARGRGLRYETVPAFGLFGGTKEKPIPMDGLDAGYAYLEDNAALEFNIPPQPDAKSFCGAIQVAKSWLRENPLEKTKCGFTDVPVMELSAKYQKDPRGQVVGCSVDFDAYQDGAQRDPFDGASLGTTRYAGGHIHLSYNVDVIPPYVAARFLDLYLSLPWLEYDRQSTRRTTYGKAGLFRPKKYGVEYRTPSNWWLWTTDGMLEVLANSALSFARRSYDSAYLKLLSEAFAGLPWSDIKTTIEHEDYNQARALIDLADRRYGLGISSKRRR